ncbi:MAG TPA: SDR family NAD(P)-dependent oxidoreductase [Ramlibacter sp.]|uniref:SDR family NAD(P)-dependent oxidoreductase n=1 Tax=Ramlibacter sp. TaxID=1917967 RepID=UPI002BB861C4|nr:SDR family NAD(P)-dependent oxidoreductase [Ramlibacter sp.]HVZ42226.1 SDR family NAD(P)-dependent oxidoreductase [Ramlibacter sp.]
MAPYTQLTTAITGACGNLGRAVAAAFAARGDKLALFDHGAEKLANLYGPDTDMRVCVACDLTDAAATQAAVRRAVERLGPIRVLCNIAGGFRMGEAVHETTDATWNFLMDLNVRTMLNTSRAVIPGMLAANAGAVVNVASSAALEGAARMGAYSASKAAVARLTESMSAELRDAGINVNCVLPSTLDTPQNRADMPKADPSRWVAPEDLANVIVFLASPAARAIHGACVPVNGRV